jgi:hypothetical protein
MATETEELRTLNCCVFKQFVDSFLYTSGSGTRLIWDFVYVNKRVLGTSAWKLI